MAEDQAEIIEFLSRGASYGAAADPERVDTHISIVFLLATRVFKLKRAVRFSFLDYSTVAAREHFCRVELALNRRTAPKLYRAVHALTRKAGGGIEWDGPGAALDWVVEMARFESRDLFDRMAVEGRLSPALMIELADAIARFHDDAAVTPAYGGAAGIEAVVEDNHGNLLAATPPLDRVRIDAVATALRSAFGKVRDLLDSRRAEGRVRRCHGDLHLRNICLYDGEPTLFDCIEFGDAFACTDTLYDLAFLLMDLEHRALRPLGNLVFNRYLDRTGDIGGLAALPLFLGVRAQVRAKVAAASLAMQKEAAERDAAAYLELAAALLAPSQPRLVAIGGLSGTGKSTVARALAGDFAPSPGARIIRSDVLRKTLSGVAPETRLPAIAYSAEMNERVYRATREQAKTVLAAGYTAILDATFIDPGQRADATLLAHEVKVPFAGLWLDAPEAVLRARVTARRGDASDADAAVLARQLAADTGAIDWQKIDATGPQALAAARAALARA